MHTSSGGKQQIFVPCGSKLLRKTERKGGVSRLCGVSSLCGASRLLGYSGDSNLLLHVLGDVESGAFFFPVQRLHGFRQVVTNVQPQQTS